MNAKDFLPVIQAIAISGVAILVHCTIFYFLFPDAESAFHFPLWMVYVFFLSFSAAITLMSVIIRWINIDLVGHAFLLTTFLEMFVSFAVFYRKLHSENGNSGTERANFIILFLLFLAIQTFVTIRLLNKKQ